MRHAWVTRHEGLFVVLYLAAMFAVIYGAYQLSTLFS